MKKSLHILGALSFIAQITFAQVGIGTTDPNDLTELHVESNTQGIVFTRLTVAQRNATLEDNDPSTPVTNATLLTGTTIFNLDDNTYEYWNGVTWTKMNSTTSGSGFTALSEIVGFDSAFFKNPYTHAGRIQWGAKQGKGGCASGACSSPDPGKLPFSTAGNTRGTDRVVFALLDAVGPNKEYGIDNRTSDVVTAKRFRFFAPSMTNEPTTALPNNVRFFPDSENGTYEVQIVFDVTYDGGVDGDIFNLEGWASSDLTIYGTAPSLGTLVTEPILNDQIYLAQPASATTQPLFTNSKVLTKGSSGNVFTDISFEIRINSTTAIFNSGVAFTLRSPSAKVTVSNLRCIVTRIR